MKWKRNRHGIYRSECGRWSACKTQHRTWRLADHRHGGRDRYYHSLATAKAGAALHAAESEQPVGRPLIDILCEE